ncbi:hypothetical protein A0H81_12538 [Grifola frondosa]|uniref:Uncharacterized protein n=1 Tax=Grifola frondosa TaxID=5627 RepID=A0A1C7LRU6_GRIFR|nr:hypothetical protein A0H81_12538 [Grifola frondosa]
METLYANGHCAAAVSSSKDRDRDLTSHISFSVLASNCIKSAMRRYFIVQPLSSLWRTPVLVTPPVAFYTMFLCSRAARASVTRCPAWADEISL